MEGIKLDITENGKKIINKVKEIATKIVDGKINSADELMTEIRKEFNDKDYEQTIAMLVSSQLAILVMKGQQDLNKETQCASVNPVASDNHMYG